MSAADADTVTAANRIVNRFFTVSLLVLVI